MNIEKIKMKKNVLLFLLVGGLMILLIGFFANKKINSSEENVKSQSKRDRIKVTNEIREEKSFLVKKQKKREGKGVKDVDGDFYKTVIIGDQEWMSENLKITKYNDGTEIPLVTDHSKWASNQEDALENPMMCYFANSLINKEKYGALYNFYVIDKTTNANKNVCPTGWHVPSDIEWEELMQFISNDQSVGSKNDNVWKEIASYLKSENTWEEGENNSNVYGFSGNPSGTRYYIGYFNGIKSDVYWWSATYSGAANAWLRNLNFKNNNVKRSNLKREYGFSIRCVRD